MKKRLKNIITSIFGALIMVADIISVSMSLFFKDSDISSISVENVIIWLLLGVIGWIFLMAKDSLLEGITLGLIKTKVNV